MANKFDGDVRPLSNDPRYMGMVFTSHRTGTIDEAIEQARTAWVFDLPAQPDRPAHISRDRWNLLEHLNMSRHYTHDRSLVAQMNLQAEIEDDTADFLVDEVLDGEISAMRKPPARAPSPYSLEYAMSRWPENFDQKMLNQLLPADWGLSS